MVLSGNRLPQNFMIHHEFPCQIKRNGHNWWHTPVPSTASPLCFFLLLACSISIPLTSVGDGFNVYRIIEGSLKSNFRQYGQMKSRDGKSQTREEKKKEDQLEAGGG